MTLTPMRYKNYTWPHNPRVYTIDYRREMAVNKIPFGLYQLQDLDRTCRVMEGEGEFVGPEAYAQFGRLANVFYQGGPGLLIHQRLSGGPAGAAAAQAGLCKIFLYLLGGHQQILHRPQTGDVSGRTEFGAGGSGGLCPVSPGGEGRHPVGHCETL